MTVPTLTAPNEGLAEQVQTLHQTLGGIGYWLIGLHTAAALFHHHVLKNATLRRMLPGNL